MQFSTQILNITHPSITSAYVKYDVESDMKKHVLVLETDFDVADIASEEEKYFDLLVDLNGIRSEAEKQYGDISRVDIRGVTCH